MHEAGHVVAREKKGLEGNTISSVPAASIYSSENPVAIFIPATCLWPYE